MIFNLVDTNKLQSIVTVTVTDESSSGLQSGRIIVLTDGTYSYSGTTASDGTAEIVVTTEGTFTPSMSNVPSGGSTTFTPSTITVAGGHEYTLGCAISFFHWIFGVRITIAESNPLTRVVYTDDAVGFTPCSNAGTSVSMGSWAGSKLISDIVPVEMSIDGNHTEHELSHTNLNYLLDGTTPATATWDKFTKIPFKWLSLSSDATYIYIKFSDIQQDASYTDWYFSYNGTVKENMYIGDFLAYVTGSNAYSRTGQTPTPNISITDWITYSQARGTGYDLFRYNQLIFLQCLYIVLFKSTDSQTALGYGYVGGSESQTTGADNTLVNEYGMYGNVSAQTSRMSFFWIEDFWGNMYQWIGGIQSNASYNLLVSDKSAITPTGWTTITTGLSTSVGGFISAVVGSQKGGFCITVGSGSETTYWCDYGDLSASAFPKFGGYWKRGANAGMFYLSVIYSATNTGASLGSRLSYGG